MNVSDILVRCSSLADIMTNIDSKELTKGHLTFFKKLHRQTKWNRSPVWGNKYTRKGILQEEHGLTLLSRHLKEPIFKNKERLNNAFITGHPDAGLGENISICKKGFDIKCSWDAHTFPYVSDGLDAQYVFQNHGYMALTGAESWTTAYALVNGLPDDIMQAKKSLWYRLACPSEFDDEYIEQCVEIEKNMIFDMEQFKRDNPHFDLTIDVVGQWDYDIPLEERVLTKEVLRDEAIIEKIYERVLKGRAFMATL